MALVAPRHYCEGVGATDNEQRETRAVRTNDISRAHLSLGVRVSRMGAGNNGHEHHGYHGNHHRHHHRYDNGYHGHHHRHEHHWLYRHHHGYHRHHYRYDNGHHHKHPAT